MTARDGNRLIARVALYLACVLSGVACADPADPRVPGLDGADAARSSRDSGTRDAMLPRDASQPVHDAGVPRDAGRDAGRGAMDAAGHDAGHDTGLADSGAPDTDTDAGSAADPPINVVGCRAPEPAQQLSRPCPNREPVPLELTTIVDVGGSAPIFLTHAPNDPLERLFVVMLGGTIAIIQDGVLLDTPFLDLTELMIMTDGFSEQGLLGLAFDPDYEVTGRFWVNYTTPSLGPGGLQTVVESYRVSTDPNVADPTTRTPLLSFEQPETNHNGGMLAFGPDGCLYMGSGDGGGDQSDGHASALCPDGNGQCLETELGKILRIDVDHPERGAPGNITGSGVPHIWDYGLRNPWRFSFDRKTGDLYIADVGEHAWEELDIEHRGIGNHNYGWRVREGKHLNVGAPPPQDDDAGSPGPINFRDPVYDYPNVQGSYKEGCIIGGYVYRGGKIPSLRGYYLFADFNSGRISAVAWNGSGLCAPPIDLGYPLSYGSASPLSFGEDADGELYVLTEGRVARIDPQ
jgi:glucose/arabinose dehydrogenase